MRASHLGASGAVIGRPPSGGRLGSQTRVAAQGWQVQLNRVCALVRLRHNDVHLRGVVQGQQQPALAATLCGSSAGGAPTQGCASAEGSAIGEGVQEAGQVETFGNWCSPSNHIACTREVHCGEAHRVPVGLWHQHSAGKYGCITA